MSQKFLTGSSMGIPSARRVLHQMHQAWDAEPNRQVEVLW